MRVGHYIVEILVNGVVLDEHDPPEDDDDAWPESGAGTKYIEATEGSEFSIRMKVMPNSNSDFPDVSFYTEIDGNRVSGSVLSSGYGQSAQPTHGEKFGEKYSVAGRNYIRSFTFQKLRTTDDHHGSKDFLQKAKELGKIEVVVNDFMRRQGFHACQRHNVDLNDAPIPEKALKGRPINISAGLGTARLSQQKSYCVNGTRGNHTLARFCFKYRSRHALQMLDLIPKTPEPVPLHERDVNTLNPAQLRMLLAEYREADNGRRNVKHEGANVKKESNEAATSLKRRIANEFDETKENGDDDCRIVAIKRCKTTNAAGDEVEVVDLS